MTVGWKNSVFNYEVVNIYLVLLTLEESTPVYLNKFGGSNTILD